MQYFYHAGFNHISAVRDTVLPKPLSGELKTSN
jgi:hypothetical protein